MSSARVSCRRHLMGHRTLTLAFAAFTFTMAIGASAHAADADKIPSQEEGRIRGEAGSAVQLNPSLVSLSAGGRYRYMTGEKTYLQIGAGLGGASTFVSSSYFSPSIHAEGRFHPVFTLRAEYSLLAFTSNDRTTFD